MKLKESDVQDFGKHMSFLPNDEETQDRIINIVNKTSGYVVQFDNK